MEIVEQGTHRQLLDARGVFHLLYMSQLKGTGDVERGCKRESPGKSIAGPLGEDYICERFFVPGGEKKNGPGEVFSPVGELIPRAWILFPPGRWIIKCAGEMISQAEGMTKYAGGVIQHAWILFPPGRGITKCVGELIPHAGGMTKYAGEMTKCTGGMTKYVGELISHAGNLILDAGNHGIPVCDRMHRRLLEWAVESLSSRRQSLVVNQLQSHFQQDLLIILIWDAEATHC